MNKTLLDILVCPVTKCTLTLSKDGNELISKVGASCMKDELHPTKNRFRGGLSCIWMTASMN